MNFEGDLVHVGDRNNQVKAALINEGGEEKWLYCESQAKEAVASQMKLSFRKRFEDELIKLSQGISKAKGRKKYTKVIERIGRLKEKHKRISGCYEINVQASEDGALATSVQWCVIPENMSDKLTGSYFLRTNLINMEAKELWQLYNSLRRVEDAFRFMKSSLGLRPVYHRLEHRVDGHLWITILAYHLIQSCLYSLNKQGITYQWSTLREMMNRGSTLREMMNRVRVTLHAKTENGKVLYHRSTTKAKESQTAIYQH